MVGWFQLLNSDQKPNSNDIGSTVIPTSRIRFPDQAGLRRCGTDAMQPAVIVYVYSRE